MILSNIDELVDRAIGRLSVDFIRNPNKYLTEDDMRMHLAFRLMPDFGEIEKTKDDDTSIALHSEVRWWGDDHREDRSDIVIFDVSSLSRHYTDVSCCRNKQIHLLYFF